MRKQALPSTLPPPLYATPAAAPTAELWAQTLRKSTGFPLKVTIVSHPEKKKEGIAFVLSSKGKSPKAESYTLDITRQQIVVRAQEAAGLFYGGQTLNQLLPPQWMDTLAPSHIAAADLPLLHIEDAPQFAWRGYMQDVSRTFFSIDFLKKYIDVMALYKLNTLHLHLTDDQGWRVEIKKYPELTSDKATVYPPEFNQPAERSGFYTQDQLRDLVRYAADRHVQIVPEIDIPGHSWPVLITHPELAVTRMLRPDYLMPFTETYHFWGNQFTPNTLDPTNEQVYSFLEDVITEVAALFPAPYFHFGGDEVRYALWQKEPRVQAFMQEHGMKKVEEVQSYFVHRISEIIRSKGKKPLGWNDILVDASGLPANTAIMSWIGSKAVKEAAKFKFPTVAVPADYLYFDIRQGTVNDGVFADLSYPYAITPEKIYSYNPFQGLTQEEQSYILGVQANMWTALPQEVKDVNIQNFPRLLALAEIAWCSPLQKDFKNFETRMEGQYPLLNALKIDYFRPEGHIIAQWTPQDIQANRYRTLEWDVTDKVYASGRVTAGLFHTQGDFLNINRMQLLEDGKTISEDNHRGFADDTRATGKRKNYLYLLNVAEYHPEARYTLRAEVSGYEGNNSYGNVTFNLCPAVPFRGVEGEKISILNTAVTPD